MAVKLVISEKVVTDFPHGENFYCDKIFSIQSNYDISLPITFLKIDTLNTT